MNEKFMERAIQLSKLGVGYTYPNPLVGAVIVKNGKVIGEGYHAYYGGPHAEINALNNAITDVKGATMYVTLEPCSHYGKTPPCANAILKSGIKEIVIGIEDPNKLVSGRGVRILRENGVNVTVGVCKENIEKLNEIFIKYITTKRPFCILKTAMTLDGKIATVSGDSKWISSETSREYVHKIRHKVSGIMVGIGTVLQDNPSLTTRLNDKKCRKCRDASRIIIDSKARIPLQSRVLNLNSDAKTIIATTELARKDKIKDIKNKGADVIITPLKNGKVDLRYLMKMLGQIGIDSVLLEGGSTLNYSALDEKIVDKVISFIAPKIVGGNNAKTPVGGSGIESINNSIMLKNIGMFKLGEDVVIEGYIKR